MTYMIHDRVDTEKIGSWLKRKTGEDRGRPNLVWAGSSWKSENPEEDRGRPNDLLRDPITLPTSYFLIEGSY